MLSVWVRVRTWSAGRAKNSSNADWRPARLSSRDPNVAPKGQNVDHQFDGQEQPATTA